MALTGAVACRPFPADPCDDAHPCPASLRCDPVSHVCVDPFVALTELRAPVTALGQGERAVPLYARLRNESGRDLSIEGLAPSFEPAAPITWRPLAPLPLPLAAGREVEVAASFSVAADALPGPLAVNAVALVHDADRGRVVSAGPLPVPLSLTIGAGPVTDTDGDGLGDLVELAYGLDPGDMDSDSDTVDDGDEGFQGAPFDSDGDGTLDFVDDDSDNGGEPDLLEHRRGSDPRSAQDDRAFEQLVVSSAVDELDGGATVDAVDLAGGPGDLSLREALTIANNRSARSRISFAPGLQAAAAPLVITSELGHNGIALPVLTHAETFVDGGGAVIAWDCDAAASLLTVAARGVVVRDLVFDATPVAPGVDRGSAVIVLEADSATLAHLTFEAFDNRPGSNAVGVSVAGMAAGTQLYKLRMVVQESNGGGLTDGVHGAGDGVTLRRSQIEVNHASLWIQNGQRWLIEDNVLHGGYDNFVLGNADCIVRRNDIGFSGSNGIRVQDHRQLIEDNVIHDSTEFGIYLWRYDSAPIQQVTLRRNLIRDSGGPAIAIEISGSQGGIAAPAIVEVAADHVAGTHAAAGAIIDLFADDLDQAGQFVGSTVVSGGQWRLDAPLPTGKHITATATDAAGNSSTLAVSAGTVPP